MVVVRVWDNDFSGGSKFEPFTGLLSEHHCTPNITSSYKQFGMSSYTRLRLFITCVNWASDSNKTPIDLEDSRTTLANAVAAEQQSVFSALMKLIDFQSGDKHGG